MTSRELILAHAPSAVVQTIADDDLTIDYAIVTLKIDPDGICLAEVELEQQTLLITIPRARVNEDGLVEAGIYIHNLNQERDARPGAGRAA